MGYLLDALTQMGFRREAVETILQNGCADIGEAVELLVDLEPEAEAETSIQVPSSSAPPLAGIWQCKGGCGLPRNKSTQFCCARCERRDGHTRTCTGSHLTESANVDEITARLQQVTLQRTPRGNAASSSTGPPLAPGYLVLRTSDHHRHLRGLHPVAWGTLERRFGLAGLLAGHLAEHGVFLQRVSDEATMRRLWAEQRLPWPPNVFP